MFENTFPNLRALHLNLWHSSLPPRPGTGLAAPIGDMTWRKDAINSVLRFSLLPLEEITAVVDNVWPAKDIWSGDPSIENRKDFATWLREELLDA